MRRPLALTTALLSLTVATLFALSRGPQEGASPNRFDLLITGGSVLDGSGGEAYRADVGIRRGRIAAVGDLAGSSAARTIAADGMMVAPGFIDGHMHVEYSIGDHPEAASLVRDGVTTVVTGNCGGSALDLRKWFAELEEKSVSINVASFVGHNTVRRWVMKSENRAPAPEELAKMSRMVEDAMRAGAVGFSTGLQYVPGTYADTEEVVALARVASAHGGLYATHMRSEEEKVFEAIAEAIGIAREAGLPLEISHFKIASKPLWGQSDRTLALVEAARAEGLDVTLDVYPYAASSTTLDYLVPAHALAGGREAFRKRIGDTETRARIAAEIYEKQHTVGGWAHLDWPVVSNCPWDASLNGKSIRDINRERGRDDSLEAEIETLIDLAARDDVQMVFHEMSESDVDRILAHPLSTIGRDSGVHAPGPTRPHPRGYGAAARVLGRYARQRGVLSMAEAVRKMTSAPAARYGFLDRGRIEEGYWADIVVFDPDTVIDRATFEKPHQYSEGIEFVLVNGQLVVEHAEHTGARPGKILRKKATD